MDKYYKNMEDYEKALRNRLKNLLEIYTKDLKYPIKFQMFGFPSLSLNNKEEHLGMIKCMCDILHEQYPVLVKQINDSTIYMELK